MRSPSTRSLVHNLRQALDETLGHSFLRFLSPTHSNCFLSPSTSLRFSPPEFHKTSFKAILGVSISANNSLPPNFHSLNCIVAYTTANFFSLLVSVLIGDSNAIILGRIQS
ncbi:hypothetical protein VNO78_12513 [Psophocarpus tetragonolobus]|uniref:Uncharacterized protein n=1 Tax=Psophocarpus tetragonolobus TaxID=3891 RepID=A0AAN9SQ24_PSOTE